MNVVQVRLDAPTEAVARTAAKQMGVQVNRVKQREDVVQLYGTKVIPADQHDQHDTHDDRNMMKQ